MSIIFTDAFEDGPSVGLEDKRMRVPHKSVCLFCNEHGPSKLVNGAAITLGMKYIGQFHLECAEVRSARVVLPDENGIIEDHRLRDPVTLT
jgi:hypothetical protein